MISKYSIYLLCCLSLFSFESGSVNNTLSISSDIIDRSVTTMCSGKVIVSNVTFVRNELMEKLGKCYGYANCTACKNCSSCKHCNSGRSCGVCSGWKNYNRIIEIETILDGGNTNGSGSKLEKNSSPTKQAVRFDAGNYYVTEENTNLRREPNLRSEIVSKLQAGQSVTKIEKTNQKGFVSGYGNDYWYRVRLDNQMEGWVFGKLIQDEDSLRIETEKETTNLKGNYSYIKADNVNMRSEPKIHPTNLVARLYTNEQCIILERNDKEEDIKPYGEDYWYKVKCSEFTGWVFGKFLSEEILLENFRTGTINGRFVNVRLEPSETSMIMGRLYKDEKCTILEKGQHEFSIPGLGLNYWYKVRSNRNEGWVFGYFIDIEE